MRRRVCLPILAAISCTRTPGPPAQSGQASQAGSPQPAHASRSFMPPRRSCRAGKRTALLRCGECQDCLAVRTAPGAVGIRDPGGDRAGGRPGREDYRGESEHPSVCIPAISSAFVTRWKTRNRWWNRRISMEGPAPTPVSSRPPGKPPPTWCQPGVLMAPRIMSGLPSRSDSRRWLLTPARSARLSGK